jgi:hypothetical protein
MSKRPGKVRKLQAHLIPALSLAPDCDPNLSKNKSGAPSEYLAGKTGTMRKAHATLTKARYERMLFYSNDVMMAV